MTRVETKKGDTSFCAVVVLLGLPVHTQGPDTSFPFEYRNSIELQC